MPENSDIQQARARIPRQAGGLLSPVPTNVALFRRLLGARFEALPARVAELHDVTGLSIWAGRADVERGRSLACRAMAALFSLPPDGRDQPLKVTLVPARGEEIWARDFGGKVFRSVQYERDGLLHERVGAAALVFALAVSPEGLSLELRDVRVMGLSLPRALHPNVRTSESERDGRYRFEAEAHLPVFGLLVHYAGWLERAGGVSA